MKKLLCAAFAVLVLAGCSGGAKTETKTCSMEQSGFKMDATFTAEDDSITKNLCKGYNGSFIRRSWRRYKADR